MDSKLAELLSLAREQVTRSPAATLTHLRTFGELLAREVGDQTHVPRQNEEGAAEYLVRLSRRRVIPQVVADRLHRLRTLGNLAAHEHQGNVRDAQDALATAAALSAWWQDQSGVNVSKTRPPAPLLHSERRNQMPSEASKVVTTFHWGSAQEPNLWSEWPPFSGSLRTFMVAKGEFSWPQKNVRVGLLSGINEIGYIETGPVPLSIQVQRGLVSEDGVSITCLFDSIIQAKDSNLERRRIAEYRGNVITLLERCIASSLAGEIKRHSIDAIELCDIEFQSQIKTALANALSEATPYNLVNCTAVFALANPDIAEARTQTAVYKETARNREIEHEIAEAEQKKRKTALEADGELAKMSAALEAELESIKLTTEFLKKNVAIELEAKQARELDIVRRERYKELLEITTNIEDVLALEAPEQYWEHRVAQSKANLQLARAAGQLADLTNLMQGEKAGLLAATMRSQLIQVDETMRAISDITERKAEESKPGSSEE